MSENSNNKTGIDNRKLSKAEQRRKENFEKIEKDLTDKGYRRTDLTISVIKANTLGVLITCPFMAAVVIFYMIINGGLTDAGNSPWPDYLNFWIFIISTVLLVVVHEGIHGLCWSFGAPNHFKDIEFGFIVQMLTPYATCKAPLSKALYITGSLMPMTLLGIIPGIICAFFGNTTLLGIFIIQILAGSGDFLISCMLIKYKTKGKEVVILDHPYECGLVAFEKQ